MQTCKEKLTEFPFIITTCTVYTVVLSITNVKTANESGRPSQGPQGRQDRGHDDGGGVGCLRPVAQVSLADAVVVLLPEPHVVLALVRLPVEVLLGVAAAAVVGHEVVVVADCVGGRGRGEEQKKDFDLVRQREKKVDSKLNDTCSISHMYTT